MLIDIDESVIEYIKNSEEDDIYVIIPYAKSTREEVLNFLKNGGHNFISLNVSILCGKKEASMINLKFGKDLLSLMRLRPQS